MTLIIQAPDCDRETWLLLARDISLSRDWERGGHGLVTVTDTGPFLGDFSLGLLRVIAQSFLGDSTIFSMVFYSGFLAESDL